MTGRIRHLRLDKGYGFITAKTGQVCFFNAADCVGCAFDLLALQARVEFDMVDMDKGLRASHVVVIE